MCGWLYIVETMLVVALLLIVVVLYHCRDDQGSPFLSLVRLFRGPIHVEPPSQPLKGSRSSLMTASFAQAYNAATGVSSR